MEDNVRSFNFEIYSKSPENNKNNYPTVQLTYNQVDEKWSFF